MVTYATTARSFGRIVGARRARAPDRSRAIGVRRSDVSSSRSARGAPGGSPRAVRRPFSSGTETSRERPSRDDVASRGSCYRFDLSPWRARRLAMVLIAQRGTSSGVGESERLRQQLVQPIPGDLCLRLTSSGAARSARRGTTEKRIQRSIANVATRRSRIASGAVHATLSRRGILSCSVRPARADRSCMRLAGPSPGP